MNVRWKLPISKYIFGYMVLGSIGACWEGTGAKRSAAANTKKDKTPSQSEAIVIRGAVFGGSCESRGQPHALYNYRHRRSTSCSSSRFVPGAWRASRLQNPCMLQRWYGLC